MTRSEIQEKIIKIVAEITDHPEDRIDASSLFKDDLRADSLAFYEISQEIEATFEIEVDEEDLEKIKTVDDAISRVEIELNRKKK